jgi:UPF0716 family protein affecting phage T7 exclusion
MVLRGYFVVANDIGILPTVGLIIWAADKQ